MGLVMPGSVGKMSNSTVKESQFDQIVLNDEEGVLLQPDFEFDEEGNIVELGMRESLRDLHEQGGTRGRSEAASAYQVRTGLDGQNLMEGHRVCIK